MEAINYDEIVNGMWNDIEGKMHYDGFERHRMTTDTENFCINYDAEVIYEEENDCDSGRTRQVPSEIAIFNMKAVWFVGEDAVRVRLDYDRIEKELAYHY